MYISFYKDSLIKMMWSLFIGIRSIFILIVLIISNE